jgi:UDP-glucose:(heptosyl)LPS alpha-1,3-glucosyltransferase
VYTPGINCFDADVISVHIVFARFYELVRNELMLRRNPVASWPRLIHRRMYYSLIRMLEKRIYSQRSVLAPISKQTARDVESVCGRNSGMSVIYHGFDAQQFNPARRHALRDLARSALSLPADAVALLLVGNDWKKKGLRCLLEAVARLRDLPVMVLVAGSDHVEPFSGLLQQDGLATRVKFLPVRADVEFYYAAADAYVAASLEDAFGLPPAEAMACGLPVIVSRRAGVSEIMNHGVDGLILENPEDAAELASLIQQVVTNPVLRKGLGENAARTTQQYTWDRNAAQLHELFQAALAAKAGV